MTELNSVTDYALTDRVAVITIDNPPVNALGFAVRSGLANGLDRAFGDEAVDAVVLHCAGRTFFAGADINEFGKPMASPVLRELAAQIEQARKPVVAAIHGTALGGGLELALACHWRVAARSAQMGLPEVKLGLLAGAGGTQRLPRLVGAEKALDMVVSGDPIDALEALKFGLIDLVAGEDLLASAVDFARRMLGHPKPLRRVRDLPAATAKPNLFAKFRADNSERLRGFEAPEASIKCVEAAVHERFDEGMRIERELFDGLMQGVQSAAQRYAFFAEREAAKVPGVSVKDASPLEAVMLRADPAELTDLSALFRGVGIEVLPFDATADDSEAASLALDLGTTENKGFVPRRTPIATDRGTADGVTIRFSPNLSRPSLLEILKNAEAPFPVIASLLVLAKRLRLAVVITHAGDRVIGNRLEARLSETIDACVRAGAARADIVATAKAFGLTIDGPADGTASQSPDALITAIVSPLIDEGAALLHEGAAARASDIDLACVRSGRWKVYRGGPMFHADQIGLARVLECLRAADAGGSVRPNPSPLLAETELSHQPLHQLVGAIDA